MSSITIQSSEGTPFIEKMLQGLRIAALRHFVRKNYKLHLRTGSIEMVRTISEDGDIFSLYWRKDIHPEFDKEIKELANRVIFRKTPIRTH
ncbi:hypothetical protein ACOBQJ_03685 [Pelotomaculum propionicicum]